MSGNLIKIQITGQFCVNKKLIEGAIQDQFVKRGQSNSHLELLVVGKRAMRSINKKYLDHDYVTDVLSFPLEIVPGEKTKLVGTIVICNDKVISEAREKGTSYEQEFVFLLRHGIDHLLGIHHEE